MRCCSRCPAGPRLAAALESASLANSDIPALISAVLAEKQAAAGVGGKPAAAAGKPAGAAAGGKPAPAVAAAPPPAAPGERVSFDGALSVIDNLQFLNPRCACWPVFATWLGACCRGTASLVGRHGEPRLLPIAAATTAAAAPRACRGKQQLGLFADRLVVKTAKADIAVALGRHQARGGACGDAGGQRSGLRWALRCAGVAHTDHTALAWSQHGRLPSARNLCPARNLCLLHTRTHRHTHTCPFRPPLQIIDRVPGDTKGRVLLYLHVDRWACHSLLLLLLPLLLLLLLPLLLLLLLLPPPLLLLLLLPLLLLLLLLGGAVLPHSCCTPPRCILPSRLSPPHTQYPRAASALRCSTARRWSPQW